MQTIKQQAILKDKLTSRKGMFFQYDAWLITVILFLIGLGLIMVLSSSVTIADRHFNDPLYYFWRQIISVSIGLSLAFIALKLPMSVWHKISVPLLLLGFIFLLMVLIPGVGREVNGSLRWIEIGPFALQASEPVKICVIAYLAGKNISFLLVNLSFDIACCLIVCI